MTNAARDTFPAPPIPEAGAMEIEIFTGPNCAYCTAAKKMLQELDPV